MKTQKHKILIAYHPEKKEEKEDIVSIFEDIQTELSAWKIEYEKTGGKDKKRGYIEKIEHPNFEITVAPYEDMIELNEAHTIYANNSQKKEMQKEKVKYFDFALQVLVDIVLEAKKEIEVKDK